MAPSVENIKTRKGLSADPGLGQRKQGGVVTAPQLLSELAPLDTGLHPCVQHTRPHMYAHTLRDT